jgi:hypothetical protein
MKIALDIIGDIPKLTSGDYSDIVREMKALGAHSHVQVVISAFKVTAFNLTIKRWFTSSTIVMQGHVSYCNNVVYGYTALLLSLLLYRCNTLITFCTDTWQAV